jgi:hypothetical protein
MQIDLLIENGKKEAISPPQIYLYILMSSEKGARSP